jgi:deoxyribonuclease V
VICCLDADYQPAGVTTACVGFEAWTDEVATIEIVLRSPGAAPAYEPGAFYKRELRYLLAVLERMPPVETIVIDGYVWLAKDTPGLGKILHDARATPIVGIAKTRYAGAEAIEVIRGDSKTPLHVTAVGLAPETAADHVRRMHGEFRVPTLIRRADALARGHA